MKCSHETVQRLLHEKSYVLKVLQPWPDWQDEERGEASWETLRELAKHPRGGTLVR
jgi:hypothetical protein